jgi:hypothetical protein
MDLLKVGLVAWLLFGPVAIAVWLFAAGVLTAIRFCGRLTLRYWLDTRDARRVGLQVRWKAPYSSPGAAR